ncbi:MAG TPA: SusC/RagA family TonB-linked outer membrane protein [Puia sp.]|nr:SusC/RagA family TonB-linked outer membrane protein [Puia sp.]
MKLTAILVTVFALHVSARAISQTISFAGKEVPLVKAFEAIKSQTGYVYFCDAAILADAKPITVVATKLPLENFLNEILQGQSLEYSIENKAIIITRKKGTTPVPKTVMVQSAPSVPYVLKGTVYSEAREPLEGAYVQIKGSSRATMTDAAGHFELNRVQPTDTLVVTNIGYSRQLVPVDNQQGLIILMKKAPKALGDVEVIAHTGFQAISKERATGSFEVVDSAQFNRVISPDIMDHLDGVVSSLVIDKRVSSGTEGYGTADPTFSIRGLSTITSSTQPLIVVDNFPYSGSSTGQILANINPDDVESVTILKDAAAASIWGSQAGNGVIVITTKKGKYNAAPKLSFSSSQTISGKPNLFYSPQLTSADYIGVEKYLFNLGYYDRLYNNQVSNNYPTLTPVVNMLYSVKNGQISQSAVDAETAGLSQLDIRNDYQKYVYQNLLQQNYNLSLSGGSDKMNYSLSGSYFKGQSNLKSSTNDKYFLAASTMFKPVKNLEISLSVGFTQNNMVTALGYLTYAALWYPYGRLADSKGNPLPIGGSYNETFNQLGQSLGLLPETQAPLQEMRLNTQTYRTHEYRLNPSVTYTILPGLKASFLYGYDYSSTLQNQDLSDSSVAIRDLINRYTQINSSGGLTYIIPVGDKLTYNYMDKTSQNLRAQLSFSHRFGSDHRIDAIAGYDHSETRTSQYSYGYYGYDAQTATYQTALNYQTAYPTTYANLLRYGAGTIASLTQYQPTTFTAAISYWANIAYNYRDKYTLSLSDRIEEANLFGVTTNNRKKPLPSAGFSWDISKEQFYHMAFLPFLKFRATYGFQGNRAFNTTAQTIIFYQSNGGYTGQNYAMLGSAANPNLRWEKVGQINLGLDFGISKGLLAGSLEYYHKQSTDLIGPYPLDPTVGFTSYVGNTSSMVGQGVDLKLSATILNHAFKWNTSFFFNYNTNKVTKYYLPVAKGYFSNAQVQAGRPVDAVYSMKWAGLDPQTGDPLGIVDGKVSKDYYNFIYNTITSKDIVYNGRTNPPYSGGLMNGFSYKGVSLSFNIKYQMGYYFRQSSISYSGLFGRSMVTMSPGYKDWESRWQKPGDEQFTHVPSMPTPTALQNEYGRDLFYQNSSVLIQRADNIVLQGLAMSYSLSRTQWKALPFSSLNISSNYNLYVLLWKANKVGVDPNYMYNTRPPHQFSLSLGAAF